MRLEKVVRGLWLSAVAACCLAVLGCGDGDISVDTTSTTAAEATITELPATTTSSTERLSMQIGTQGEGVVSPNPAGSSLVRDWTRREGDCMVRLVFEADGTVYLSYVPDDPELPGDAVFGTYRVRGTKLTTYGLNAAQWSCTYSIKGGVLKMPEPGMGATVYEWR